MWHVYIHSIEINSVFAFLTPWCESVRGNNGNRNFFTGLCFIFIVCFIPDCILSCCVVYTFSFSLLISDLQTLLHTVGCLGFSHLCHFLLQVSKGQGMVPTVSVEEPSFLRLAEKHRDPTLISALTKWVIQSSITQYTIIKSRFRKDSLIMHVSP